MSTMMTPFDKLTWGDPMLAQIGGSDAQAFATDPHLGVIDNMSSGPEQAPDAVLSYVSGENQPAQQAGANAPLNCPWWDLVCISMQHKPFGDPTTATTDPRTGCAWWDVKCNITKGSSGGGGTVSAPSGADFNSIAVKIVLAALAIGLVFIGVKTITEA